MITISLIMVVKVVAYAMLCFVTAVVVLFPVNDKPTTFAQWIIFFMVCAVWFDILFTHIIGSHIQFVP